MARVGGEGREGSGRCTLVCKLVGTEQTPALSYFFECISVFLFGHLFGHLFGRLFGHLFGHHLTPPPAQNRHFQNREGFTGVVESFLRAKSLISEH